ncbi:MAG: AAA family ATPase [Acidimicrobiales bacterium]
MNTTRTITNRYPGKCTECGDPVAAGAGLAYKTESGWATKHSACPNGNASTSRGYAPTDEQAAAIKWFATGENLAIEAGAGTGKTSTLIMLAEHARDNGRAGTYLAFNKAIVTEAGMKLPGNMTASTAHALAYRAHGYRYKGRLGAPRMTPQTLADLIGTDAMVVTVGDQPRTLARSYLASVVMRTIGEFCKTAADEPTRRHVPYIDGIDLPNEAGNRTYDNNDRVADYVMPFVRKAWADLAAVDGRLPYGHDVYLKQYQLSGPRIETDFILFDEAQDANPVMLAIVNGQADHSQLVFVGDSCQPPGTMVEVVVGRDGNRWLTEERPIEQLRVGDRVVSFDVAGSHLHRAGRPITGISSRPFHGDLVAAKASGNVSRYTPDHRCVVKIGRAFDDRQVVYVMRRGSQYRVGRAQGRYGAGFGPALRAAAERADAMWILSAHDTAEDAALAEATVAQRFGIPTWTWVAATKGPMGQDSLDVFWDRVGDLTEQGAALLRAHGRDPRFPLWEPRRAGGRHFMLRRTLAIRACNLMTGMEMLPATEAAKRYGKEIGARWWEPIEVSAEAYTGPVWSMDVADHHTYVADGLVTHNCQQIYEFTGAVNALATIRETGANVTYLSQSFRFGQAVADVANGLLGRLDSELRLSGFGQVASAVGAVAEPDCILSRTNAVAVRRVLTELAAGRRPYLVGGGGEVAAFAKAARQLQTDGHTGYHELACFASWGEVQEYVSGEDGSDLKLMVNLIDEFGIDAILQAMDGLVREADADLIVSTAHKSKGREWASVQIAGDFRKAEGEGELPPAELRLMYVACTRARLELDIDACPQAIGQKPGQ